MVRRSFPMDETLTRVALDASNRPYLIWKVDFSRDKLGTMDTELFKEWFQAFAQHAGLTLHVENLYGTNNHHIVESCFKGLARALRGAIQIRSEEHTSELQSLMRISYAVFCLKKKIIASALTGGAMSTL